jgi:two-component system, NtrC family, sensor kinase
MSLLIQFKPDFLQATPTSDGPYRHTFDYRSIWKKAILIALLVSLCPLIIITTIDYKYTQNSIQSENLLRTLRVGSNARRSISFFLSERLSALSFIVHGNTIEELKDPEKLQSILQNLLASFNCFVDLGLIDQNGVQLNYVGPYPLEGKDYSNQAWFQQVKDTNFSISEVFIGFRNVPHLILAEKYLMPDGSFYILRTAIDASRFEDFLSALQLSGRGDAFLINSSGIIQTPTLYHGNLFEQFPYPVPTYSINTEIREEVDKAGNEVIICSAFIAESPYILVIIKQKDELMKPWRNTRLKLIGFLVISVSLILLVIFGLVTYMVNNMYHLDQRRLSSVHKMEYSNKLASIGRLSAGVAHEINNPLAIINEKAGLIKDILTYSEIPVQNPRVIELIDSVLSSVERCGTITKRLLSFARHMDSTFETINLPNVIHDVLGFLHKEAEYRNIVITTDLADDIPEFISDRGKLQQIFLNIINNAFSAMKTDGRLNIVVRHHSDEKTIVATITDNGCGISDGDMGKIFEPFFSTKTRQGGTGLGLSITFGLVMELGGKVNVTSKLGEGTSFFITLPLNPPQQKTEK